jgi:uncharacterized repeat protein (TIGR03803 family)
MIRNHWRGWIAAVAAVLLFASTPASARSYQMLYAFAGGSDGASPAGRVILDKAGNVYGTTEYGGGAQACTANGGCGTIFKLAPDGTESVLYTFTGLSDGAYPAAGLTRDSSGNLLGTAVAGGSNGCGTIFQLAAGGAFTVLHAFTCNGRDGTDPDGELLRTSRGAYVGTTNGPGLGCCGNIYRLSRTGKLKVLYAFTGGDDGQDPLGSLIEDAAGNLYGVALIGGQSGWGTVFELKADGSEVPLHAFTDGSDGAWPDGGLLLDGSGNLYGTAAAGGELCGQVDEGCGTLFKLAPDGTFSVLYTFSGGNDGAIPYGPLIADAKGNLYGTANQGGQCGNLFGGCGTVFALAPGGAFTVLHTFTGGNDGRYPEAGLVDGRDGYLYGTTNQGGGGPCNQGCGTVFRIRR